MKVLLTGASGFIGAHLSRLLLSQGLQVVGLYHRQAIRFAHPGLITEQHDLSQAGFSQLLDKHLPDALIHTAAMNPSVHQQVDRQLFHHFNHEVTMSLVDAFVDYAERCCAQEQLGHKKLINLSTYEVYGEAVSTAGHGPSAAMAPLTDYARSKAQTHQAIANLETTHVQLINAVLSNNYGPWQSQDKLIPAVATNLLAGKPIHVYGDGSSRRTWTHIDDTCDGLSQVLRLGRLNTYHLCSEEELTVKEMIQKIHHQLRQMGLVKTAEPHIIWHEAAYNPVFKMHHPAAENDIEWQASIDIDTGLAMTLKHLVNTP